MLEPSMPVTLKMRYTPYPAVELQSDEGRALGQGSVILRHRHLKRQFTIVPSGSSQTPRFAQSRCSYQVVTPANCLAAAAVTLPAGVAPSPAPASRPPAIPSSSSSVSPIPPAAGPSVVYPPVVAAASVPTIPALVARAEGTRVSEVAMPSTLGISSAVRSEGKGSSFPPVQPLPVLHSRRNTTRSHEIVETSDSSLVVRRGQRAIRDKKGQTTWFYSNGQTYILKPPVLASAQLGDLYVHTSANRDQQIWIFNRDSEWEKIQLYHPHPVLSGYVLHRLGDGEPRWIHKTTLTTYRGREKRNQQMCFRSDREVESATSSGQAARLADML